MNASDDPGARAKTEPEADHEPTLFEWAGGSPALLRMTRIFYGKYVPEDPLLAPLFADMAPDHPERVAAWLGETLGGPTAYTETYGGYDRMVSRHLGKALRRSSVRGGCNCSARLPTTPGSRSTPSGGPRSSRISSGVRGSRSRIPNRAPTRRAHARAPLVVGLRRHPWLEKSRRLPSDTATGRRVDRAPRASMSTSASPSTSNLSSGRGIAARCALRSTSGRTTSVSAHAPAILDRLRAGTMPCDGGWPEDRVAVFERWIDSGKAA